MKCCCYETDSAFTFCVEDVENAQLEDGITHMGLKKTDGKFIMSYPQHEFDSRDKELVSKNFIRLGQSMFESMLSRVDWEKPLELVTQKFNKNGIEWYIVGSICDVVRGIAVKPFDIDIVVHTRDYRKAKEICYSIFSDSVTFPFQENQKRCPLRSYGQLFLAGAWIEIAADKSWNLENRQSEYEKTVWRGYNVCMETLQHRYNVEIARNRTDRIKALSELMN